MKRLVLIVTILSMAGIGSRMPVRTVVSRATAATAVAPRLPDWVGNRPPLIKGGAPWPGGPKIDAKKDVCQRKDLPAAMMGACCQQFQIACDSAKNPCNSNPIFANYNAFEVKPGKGSVVVNNVDYLCCPPNQIPTGLEQPSATCAVKSAVKEADITNSTILAGATGTMLLRLLAKGLFGGSNVMLCYDQGARGCLALAGYDQASIDKMLGDMKGDLLSGACSERSGDLRALNLKTCIEMAWTACLAGKSLF